MSGRLTRSNEGRSVRFADQLSTASTSYLLGLLATHADAGESAMFAVSEGGDVLAHDVRFLRMWGLHDDALAEGSLSSVLRALDAADRPAPMIASLLDTRDVERAGEIASPDGRIIEWRVAETAEVPRARVWAFRDRSSSGDALRAAENWLRMFAAHTEGMVLALDRDARVAGAWAPDGTFLGASDADLRGRTLVDALGEEHGSLFEERVRQVLATGQTQTFDYERDVDGETRAFSANAVLVTSANGQTPSCTVLVRDVTERMRMQRKLLQAERLASVGVLAAGIAHEINNPLAYMLLNLERLRTGLERIAEGTKSQPSPQLGELAQCVEITLEGAQRVGEIVGGLKRFARADREEPRVPIDLRRVLAFSLDMTSAELRSKARIETDYGPVPNVLASEAHLNQVFLNLLSNAGEAFDVPGSDLNEIRVSTETDERGRAVVSVRDNGVGIPDVHLARVFDPFFTTRAPGTGLGLAICHGIVAAMGGEITVESAEGWGTVFHVALPPAELDASR